MGGSRVHFGGRHGLGRDRQVVVLGGELRPLRRRRERHQLGRPGERARGSQPRPEEGGLREGCSRVDPRVRDMRGSQFKVPRGSPEHREAREGGPAPLHGARKGRPRGGGPDVLRSLPQGLQSHHQRSRGADGGAQDVRLESPRPEASAEGGEEAVRREGRRGEDRVQGAHGGALQVDPAQRHSGPPPLGREGRHEEGH